MGKIEMGRGCIVWCIVSCIEKKKGVLIERKEYNRYQFSNQYNTWRESIKMGVGYGGMGADI